MVVKRKGVSRAKQSIDVDGGNGAQVTEGQGAIGGGGETDSVYVRVVERAYDLWLASGSPDRGAMEFWLQAEAELKHDLQESQSDTAS